LVRSESSNYLHYFVPELNGWVESGLDDIASFGSHLPARSIHMKEWFSLRASDSGAPGFCGVLLFNHSSELSGE